MPDATTIEQGPLLVTGGLVRRIVIDAGCVWIEEYRAAQRYLAWALAISIVLGLAMPICILLGVVDSSIDRPTMAIPVVVGLGIVLRIYFRTLRPRPSIGPARDVGWQRIACADPQRQWFWDGPQRGVPLSSVQVEIQRLWADVRGAGQRMRWRLVVRWPDTTLDIHLAPDDPGDYLPPTPPPSLVEKARLLAQWGLTFAP